MWDRLAKNKSLFTCGDNYGLPIGNLTSQCFANFYLHWFDLYVKNEFGFYGRYVDDFYVICKNRNKISKFEADKANIVYKKFKDIYDDVPILDNGNITIGNSKYLASKNMVTFEEHYNYNFDSKKLVYKLSIIYEDNLGGFGFEREIEL